METDKAVQTAYIIIYALKLRTGQIAKPDASHSHGNISTRHKSVFGGKEILTASLHHEVTAHSSMPG